jgi:hypothetical protein
LRGILAKLASENDQSTMGSESEGMVRNSRKRGLAAKMLFAAMPRTFCLAEWGVNM